MNKTPYVLLKLSKQYNKHVLFTYKTAGLSIMYQSIFIESL
jgi:hypothetical protein